jgi:hypothetical protein
VRQRRLQLIRLKRMIVQNDDWPEVLGVNYDGTKRG